MSQPEHDEEEDERSFFQRNRLVICVAASIAIGALILLSRSLSSQGHAQHKAPELTMVSLKLPPPPPPPPPPPQQQEQKMIEQAPVNEPEQKPEPKADSPPDLGTNIKGDGPSDGFGLNGSNGSGRPGGLSGSRNGGSRWGWYAGQVQTRIADALRNNRKTRSASISGLQIRIWPDTTGRVTRAQLVASTGNPAVDEAIKNEVLTGLQLQEPPPAGMPSPIVLRLSARRPN